MLILLCNPFSNEIKLFQFNTLCNVMTLKVLSLLFCISTNGSCFGDFSDPREGPPPPSSPLSQEQCFQPGQTVLLPTAQVYTVH